VWETAKAATFKGRSCWKLSLSLEPRTSDQPEADVHENELTGRFWPLVTSRRAKSHGPQAL